MLGEKGALLALGQRKPTAKRKTLRGPRALLCFTLLAFVLL